MTDEPAPARPGADVVRSEERLRVSTRSVPIGRAVLRRTVVVEQRTITVEVRHEEVRLEVLPYESGDPEDLDGPHAAHLALPDVVLRREEVVVTKRLVPTERVRLELRTVTGYQRVTEAVRHEEIETVGDVSPVPPPPTPAPEPREAPR